MSFIFNERTLLALIAAAGYGVATILMKILADRPELIFMLALLAVMTGTVVAEVFLLRKINLGLAYVAIIATETVLVLSYAMMIGEGLSPREWLGAAFIVAGVSLVSF